VVEIRAENAFALHRNMMPVDDSIDGGASECFLLGPLTNQSAGVVLTRYLYTHAADGGGGGGGKPHKRRSRILAGFKFHHHHHHHHHHHKGGGMAVEGEGELQPQPSQQQQQQAEDGAVKGELTLLTVIEVRQRHR